MALTLWKGLSYHIPFRQKLAENCHPRVSDPWASTSFPSADDFVIGLAQHLLCSFWDADAVFMALALRRAAIAMRSPRLAVEDILDDRARLRVNLRRHHDHASF